MVFQNHKDLTFLKIYMDLSYKCLQLDYFVLLGAHESLVQNAVPVTMHVHLLQLSPLGNTAPALYVCPLYMQSKKRNIRKIEIYIKMFNVI